MKDLIAILELLRPWQWVKNILVFLPAFFGGRLIYPEAWTGSIVVFCTFCFASGAVYCVNDVMDRTSDASHPNRKRRPVASGRISVCAALITAIVVISCAVAIPLFFLKESGGVVAMVISAYLLLNIFYCLWMKHVAILDVVIIAVGYVFRLVAGGVACYVHLSPWIVIMVFLITLFIAVAKRRSDVLLRDSGTHSGRESTRGYTLPFLDNVLAVIASATIVSYILYTVSPEVVQRLNSEYLYVTAVFVLAGILRYMQLVIVEGRGDNPVRILFCDKWLQLCLWAWLMTFVIIIYV